MADIKASSTASDTLNSANSGGATDHRITLPEGEMGRPGEEDAPPGWTYNPSAWPQRRPIIALALLNCGIAGYLAVCQTWFHGAAWDPFFGNGTQRVLTSSISQTFPVSEAALGAAAYLLEAILGTLGNTRRWRTRPWLALSFGLLMLPLFLTGIGLLILQPIVVHAWCSLCLAMLAGMLLMVPLALDEVIATLQFLLGSYQRHRSLSTLWRAFWHGEEGENRQDAVAAEAGARASSHASSPFTGFTPTWSLVSCLALGLGCLFAPAVLGADWDAASSLYVTGALIVTVSTLAMAEVARSLRFALMFCGVWLLVFAPWTLLGASAALKIVEMLMGAALMGLSYPRGHIRREYAGWERFMP